MRILSSSSSSFFDPSRAIRFGIVNQQLDMDLELSEWLAAGRRVP